MWIDEAGRIVRPPEHAGAHDVLRDIDLETFEIPDEVAARGQEARAEYADALRDWVAKGDASRFVLSAEEVAARAAAPDSGDSLASAEFQIGAWHAARGDWDAAKPFFEAAVERRPETWTFHRQKIAASGPEAVGEIAADEGYFQTIYALGDKKYYEPFQP